MPLSEDLRNELAAIAPERDCYRLAELSGLAHSAGRLLPSVEVQPDDLTLIQFTSGSTGEPRGVMVSHGNLIDNLQRLETLFRLIAFISFSHTAQPSSEHPLFKLPFPETGPGAGSGRARFFPHSDAPARSRHLGNAHRSAVERGVWMQYADLNRPREPSHRGLN